MRLDEINGDQDRIDEAWQGWKLIGQSMAGIFSQYQQSASEVTRDEMLGMHLFNRTMGSIKAKWHNVTWRVLDHVLLDIMKESSDPADAVNELLSAEMIKKQVRQLLIKQKIPPDPVVVFNWNKDTLPISGLKSGEEDTDDREQIKRFANSAQLTVGILIGLAVVKRNNLRLIRSRQKQASDADQPSTDTPTTEPAQAPKVEKPGPTAASPPFTIDQIKDLETKLRELENRSP